MDASTDNTTLDRRLRERLRAAGGRVTSQRLVIHRALGGRRHLSAEGVRATVAEELPGVSLPTIYATLELLADLGLARRIDAGTGRVLYDGRTERHPHAACRRCGRVDDLDAPHDLAGAAAASKAGARAIGFTPEHADLVVTGLCAACAGAGRGEGPPAGSSPLVEAERQT